MTVLTEMRNVFGPFPDLPPPFGAAMKRVLMHGLNMEFYSDAVSVPRGELPTTLSRGDSKVPMVFVGNAVHSVPTHLDYSSIGETCADAVRLGEMIADAWHDEKELEHVPRLFYDRHCPIWSQRTKKWLDLWQRQHQGPTMPQQPWIRLQEAIPPEEAEQAPVEAKQNNPFERATKVFLKKDAERRIVGSRMQSHSKGKLLFGHWQDRFLQTQRRKAPGKDTSRKVYRPSKDAKGITLDFTDLYFCQEFKRYPELQAIMEQWVEGVRASQGDDAAEEARRNAMTYLREGTQVQKTESPGH